MPEREPRTINYVCSAAGCNKISTSSRCPECQKEAEQARLSRHERGYDKKWEKLRDKFIKAFSLCQDCKAQGRTRPAQQVHHVIPFQGVDDPLRLDWTNLAALCKDCHQQRHNQLTTNTERG